MPAAGFWAAAEATGLGGGPPTPPQKQSMGSSQDPHNRLPVSLPDARPEKPIFAELGR
mgnify:CR=1 FL=1